MNHNDTHSESDGSIRPDLEARIVASVLGEASAFEMAELDRLLGDQPELAIFKRRIEAVNGLVRSAVRPEQAPMRLAPERRARLLQVFGATTSGESSPDATAPIILQLAEARRKRRTRFIWTSAIAASLTFGAILTLNVNRFTKGVMEMEGADRVSVNFERPSPAMIEVDAAEEERLVLSPFQVSEDKTNNGAQRQVSPKERAPDRVYGALRFAPAEFKKSVSAQDGDQLSQGLLDQAIDKGMKAKGDRQSPIFERSIANSSPNGLAFGSGTPVITGDFYNNRMDGNPPESRSFTAGYVGGVANARPAVLPPLDAIGQFESGNTRYYSIIAGTRVRTDLSSFLPPPLPGGEPARFTAQKSENGSWAASFDDNFLNEPRDSNASTTVDLLGGTIARADTITPERFAREDSLAAAKIAQSRIESSQGEISAAQNSVSTFSLHVSDVSYRLAQAALARGETPNPARIRPEEFYNAFDYGDPSPSTSEKISSRIEQSAHPFLQQRNLVRIATKVASTGRGAGQPLHLTVLLDTSGSMEREDRIHSVRSALTILASLLTVNDRVTMIGFARQPRLLAEALPGDQAGKLVELASQTPFTGGTNLEEALKLSGELAQRHYDNAAQNRIVLITDGAANLGNADPAQLATTIETWRQQGLAFDACGVGTDGLDDSILEALTRKGDGRYYVLDDAADAEAGFARKLAGAFRPAAENVKLQVRFNPSRVGSYRLIGFEQHRLREEDFRNDQIDAAELAADEAAVALYQVEVLPNGSGELGEVVVRFRDPGSREMLERSWPILHEARASAFDRTSPSIQLAGTAALLAEKLRGGEWADAVDLDELAPVVNTLRGHYAAQAEVQELIAMFEQLRRRSSR